MKHICTHPLLPPPPPHTHTYTHTPTHSQLCEEAGIEATAMDWKGVLHFKMGDNPQPWEVHGMFFVVRVDTCVVVVCVFAVVLPAFA